MKKILFAAFLLGFFNLIYSQEVIIKGTEKSYAGDELVLYSYSDLITHEERIITNCKVDSVGNFIFQLNIDQTIIAYIYLEIYKGFIFLEPGRTYEVKLPPKTPKVFEDQINPFFQESEFYIGVTNSEENELNYLIKRFDTRYNTYVENNFNMIRYTGSTEVDTMITKLTEEFESFDNPYFKDYVFYKLATLRFLSYERNTNTISRYYFLDKPLLYHNVAYMDMFNQVFDNFFYKFSKTRAGEQIYSNVALEKSIYKIKQTLDKNLAFTNDTLKELMILKACYDECYANNYPFSSLKQTLDSLKILTTILVHREIAKTIIKKTTHLRDGYKAPEFEVFDSTGKAYHLPEYKGNFLYLNYCTDWSYKCKEEFSLLKNIYKNHSDKLEILTIVPESDYRNLTNFFDNNEFTWPIYYYSDDSIVEDYNLRVYPTYYLVGQEGKLIMSPAPGPNENFEWRFFKILRNQENNNKSRQK